MSRDRTPDNGTADSNETLGIDFAAKEQEKLQRSLQLNLSRIPELRLPAAILLVVTIFIYNQWAGVPRSNGGLIGFTVAILIYGVATWLLLGRFNQPDRRPSFGVTFSALDVVFVAWAMHLTGGEASWLILLLPLRTADQASSGFKRSLFFAHWTTFAYLGLLLWIQLVDGRAISWPTEVVKLLLIYGVNLYLAFSARLIDQRRRMTLDWVSLSKNLIQEMQNQATELEAARAKAQAASRAKSHFLANMSHELRTPMNAVMGLADLMALHRLDKTQRRRVNLLRESAIDLQEVIENLLDFSRIEAEELTLEFADCDLREVIRGVLKRLGPRAESKGLNLETRVDSNLSPHLRMDPLRVRQVLMHLVDNAIKFTEEGHVAVRVRSREDGPGTVSLHFQIEDTGIGIPQQEIRRLFEPFSQLDDSLTREQGGTGLGLPICRRLVEMMDGEIGVRSRLGRGSTFWFKLPAQVLSVGTYTKLPVNDTVDVERARVLVVEDNPVNQEVIGSMLKGMGFDVAQANHGAEALEMLSERRYDIVLMDCQMPTMDGYRATEEIRRREGDGRHIPIVAVTAHAMEGDRERCLAAGMDDYLAKPLNFENLSQTLSRWIEL